MASSSTAMRVWLLILLIFSVHVISSVAKNFDNRKTLKKRIDSAAILREMGYDMAKLKVKGYIRDAEDKDRVTPGGPNGQHHNEPPSHA